MNNEMCNACGRPMSYCKGNCSKCKDLRFTEYCGKADGCFREKTPGCPLQAVIPTVTVDNMTNINELADCLVHVTDINTTLYIDDKHRPVITWAGPVDIPGYNLRENPKNLRNQIVMDSSAGTAAIYNAKGKAYIFGIEEGLNIEEAAARVIERMAEDGTLAELVGEKLRPYIDSRDESILLESKEYTDEEIEKRHEEARFIFPKFWPNVGSGDCNLIKYHGKNILIDCHNTPQWTYVRNMLNDNDARHIDILVITHYHADHEGNLENLINNGYVDTSTAVYMSAETTTFGTSYNNEMKARLNLLRNKGIGYTIPSEGEELIIEDKLKFTFYNCDKDILDSYPTKYANSCSTVIFMEYGNTRMFYTGDAGQAVFQRLRGLGLPKYPIDLYKMGHHGIDQRTDPEFIRTLSARYAVQPSGIADAAKNNFGICEDAAVLKSIGTKIFPYYMQQDYIEFVSDGSSVQCISGKPYGTSTQRPEIRYYVDKNASKNEIQDGSQEHPFSEVMQAVSSIKSGDCNTVNIYIAPGYYGDAHEVETAKNRITIGTGKNNRIILTGDVNNRRAVVLNGILVLCSNIQLNSLTVDIGKQSGLTAYDSKIQLDDVLFNSSTGIIEHSAILLREGSMLTTKLQGKPNRIEQFHEGIIVQTGSKVVLNGTLEIGSHDSNIINSNGNIVYTGRHLVFDDVNDKYNFSWYSLTERTPVQIMKAHTAYAQSIELVRSAADFRWIQIDYRGNDGFRGTTGKIYYPNTKNISVTIPLLAGNGELYNKQCLFRIDNKTISIDQSLQLHIVNGGYPSIEKSTVYFDIERVIGGFDDYIDIAS